MSKVFDIHVLPAQRGDALWVEYGEDDRRHHILIDGGITATGRTHLQERIRQVGTPLHFELLVVTHIDLDHILGILAFLQELPEGVTFGDIWFNGWDQLKGIALEPQGVKEGVTLSDLLQERHAGTWNRATGGAAVALAADGSVPEIPALPGGMKIQVLGPGRAQLDKLREKWHEVVEEFGAGEDMEQRGEAPVAADAFPGLEALGPVDVAALAQARFDEDDTVPNGSSIALLLEFAGSKALMLADAYPSVVLASLRALQPRGRIRVDAVKLAHHGSRANTSRALAAALQAPTWIFSSNGANNTKHPHKEAVARVLHDGQGVKTLVFNYRTGFNAVWDDADLKEEHGYETVYGDGETPVLVKLR